MEYSDEKLKELLETIKPADYEAIQKAKERQSKLAKPPGSLGGLEEISIRLAGITGRVNNSIEKKRLIVLAADNGVVEEGVSSAPQSVTLAQTINLTRGITGASSLAKHFKDELVVVDMGVNAVINCPAVVDKKIAMGTKNIHKGPAMTREQAIRGILTGIELADAAKKEGVDAIGVGEMGIGNTTTSSAILTVLTGAAVDDTTGKGGGLTDDSFFKKKRIIEEAIALNKPDKNDVVDVISKIGGFDIAAMTGVFLGSAINRVPVVIDGFISVIAALCAARLCPFVKDYLFPSHASYEKGYMMAAKELGLKPFLLLGMRLGEGSGCPIAFEVLSAACAVMNNMATFDQASINDDYLEDIRQGDKFTVRGSSAS
jgi:nicotinate-nucleotide--dimethylbenzimidazole phosphoribosyltransferase